MSRLALVEERETLDAPLEPSTPAVVVVDDTRRCVEVNVGACELLGRSRSEILGRVFDSLVAAESRERIGHFWRAFADQGGHAGPFVARDGVEVEIAVTRNVIAGRHLLMLSPAGRRPRSSRFAQPRPDREPVAREQNGRTPSAREREILRLLATGATDPQIAAQLGLSPATVQTHVRNAKAKLGARTRAQAVAMAIGRELISLPPATSA
jgi:PAS domain S-box-containing protein